MSHGDSREAMTPVIRDLTSRELEAWPVGRPFALLPGMRRLTLSVAARLILGVSDRTELNRIERCLTEVLKPYPMLAGRAALERLGPASPQAAAGRHRRTFGRCVAAALGSDTVSLGADETFALLLAGHETTATALAWAIRELARAPTIADAVAGEPAAGDRPWLDAVIHETLRLHPPLVDIVRQPAGAVELAGREVPAGTLLLIPPPLIHRSATPDEPARFGPERFLARRPDPRTWIRFGGGERRCLGASLAMLELREVLPPIVKRFVLIPAREELERVRLFGTAIPPDKGARVVLSPRRDGAEQADDLSERIPLVT
jgi:cytochrome P450